MSERKIDALKCITFNDEYYLLYIPVYAYTQARTQAHAHKERLDRQRTQRQNLYEPLRQSTQSVQQGGQVKSLCERSVGVSREPVWPSGKALGW